MATSKQSVVLDVVPVRQPIGEFYAGSILARDLVAITFSDVRRLAEDPRDIERYLGIQRPINQKRVSEIKKYVEGRDATFPTAVIVAVDEKCAEYDPEEKRLRLFEFVPEKGSDDPPIPFSKLARVIDGQHRIAAFMDDKASWSFVETDNNRDFELNVAIFVGADISEQANIFATVNLAQTKVNRSLVYDLTELASRRSPYKSCHEVAVMLDREKKSPLYRRIKRLGTATPGRKFEPLTQAAFVESLVKFISSDPVSDRNDLLAGRRLKKATFSELVSVPFRNLFIEGREVDMAEILYNYFSAVRNKWPTSWDDLGKTNNLLPKSNAFKALMRYLKEDVYGDIVGLNIGLVPKVSEFAKYFAGIEIKDSDFTSKNFVPGSGGQATFLKILRRQVSLQDLIEN